MMQDAAHPNAMDREQPPVPPRRSGLVRWLTRASVVGLAASLLFHVVLSYLLGGLIVGQRGNSSVQGDGDGIEVELQSEVRQELATVETGASAENSGFARALREDASLTPSLEQLSSDLAMREISETGLVPLVGSLANDAEGFVVGGSVGAEFFGIEARGNRFAYVVDLSASMQGARLEILKQELIASISELRRGAKFFVVTYSSDAQVLDGRTSWVSATDEYKLWARRQISQLQVLSSTEPKHAFRLLRRLGTAADAVFFLTDGNFDAANALEVMTIQRELGVPIHAITLDSRTGEQVMRQIAEASDGTYRHVTADRRRR